MKRELRTERAGRSLSATAIMAFGLLLAAAPAPTLAQTPPAGPTPPSASETPTAPKAEPPKAETPPAETKSPPPAPPGNETGSIKPPAQAPEAKVQDPPPAEKKPEPPPKPVEAKPEVEKPAPPPAPAPAKPAEAPKPPAELVVATWGGAYAAAQEAAFADPFAKATTTKVKIVRHGGAGREIEAISGSGTPDVVDMSSGALHEACAKGLLEPLEDLKLPPAAGGQPAADDFLPGGLTRCGIATAAWSSVVLVNVTVFKRAAPKSLAEVFDAKRFPGKRAFAKSPRYLLEMALLADDVPPAEVYDKLKTDEGLERALAKLTALRGEIVWTDKAADGMKLIRDGGVAVATAFSGRVFHELAGSRTVRPIWDGQIYDIDYWAIPKAARNKEAARDFIVAAGDPARMAENARRFPYGPMRRSAVAQVGKHAVLGIDLAPHLPTSPANLKLALKLDTAWWSEHGKRITERFDAWLAGEATPKPASGG